MRRRPQPVEEDPRDISSGYDEHTETTLVRYAQGLPIPALELEHAARQLVAAMTDPARPENWLKRPATRTCVWCGGQWKTRLALLACSPYCQPACEDAALAHAEQVLGEVAELRRAARAASVADGDASAGVPAPPPGPKPGPRP
jgi:hypothetical protein